MAGFANADFLWDSKEGVCSEYLLTTQKILLAMTVKVYPERMYVYDILNGLKDIVISVLGIEAEIQNCSICSLYLANTQWNYFKPKIIPLRICMSTA